MCVCGGGDGSKVGVRVGSNADEGGEKNTQRNKAKERRGDKEPQEGGRMTATQSRPRKKKHPYSEMGGGGSSSC